MAERDGPVLGLSRCRLCSYDPALAQPLPRDVRTPVDVSRFIAHRDMADGPVQMAAGSSIRWMGDYGSQTELCVLYMHGWSASPRESEPVDVRVAQELRANHLRFRLSGHGLCPLERSRFAVSFVASDGSKYGIVAKAIHGCSFSAKPVSFLDRA